MRFHWFHLMPYQDLPADFEKRYHSIWVDPPSSELYDPVAGQRMYNDYLDELEFADEMGFDGICVNEHHQNAYGMMPSPNLMAAALARRTSKSALVVLGNSIALYNPPIRVAEEFAMLDVISGGRLVAGFPLGTPMDTTFAYGQVPATLRDKYQEAHDLILQAWTRQDTFTFNGKYTQLRYVNMWPRPFQRPHPPIWVPGSGSPDTQEWVAKYNYVYCFLSYWGAQRGKAVMDSYWQNAEKVGADRNPYHAGFLQLIAVSETDAKAEEEYSDAAHYFYDKTQLLHPGFAEPPGFRPRHVVQFNLTQGDGRAAQKALTWKDYIDRGYIIAGSPATVRDRLKDMIQDLRIGQLMVLQHFGNLSKQQTMKNTQLFAQEVMPHLKGLWPGWEDHWYPKPVAEQRAAAGVR
jgi:alkanesulfonate monooxygenase SsuD/methylene tetrahydromethanopterin reductase-like flavin-dependent oxidoreductase (luciferase family)